MTFLKLTFITGRGRWQNPKRFRRERGTWYQTRPLGGSRVEEKHLLVGKTAADTRQDSTNAVCLMYRCLISHRVGRDRRTRNIPAPPRRRSLAFHANFSSKWLELRDTTYSTGSTPSWRNARRLKLRLNEPVSITEPTLRRMRAESSIQHLESA